MRRPTPFALLLLAGALHGQSLSFDNAGPFSSRVDVAYVACDDVVSGANSEPCDVGASSFTIEMWLQSDPTENGNTNGDGCDTDVAAYTFTGSNIFLDRDVNGGSCEGFDFGAGILNNCVVLSIGASAGAEYSTYGATDITDGEWHHVALVRDASANRLLIYVDGALDRQSSSGPGTGDISIPDAGCTQGGADDAEIQAELHFGAEKHGAEDLDYDGLVDEIRIWDVARSAGEIAANYHRSVSCGGDLVLYWRTDEGSGSTLVEACGDSSQNGVFDQTNDASWSAENAPLVDAASALRATGARLSGVALQ